MEFRHQWRHFCLWRRLAGADAGTGVAIGPGLPGGVTVVRRINMTVTTIASTTMAAAIPNDTRMPCCPAEAMAPEARSGLTNVRRADASQTVMPHIADG
jgi:hypothetical protein